VDLSKILDMGFGAGLVNGCYSFVNAMV
jgi:hypothetical protein